MKFYISYFVRLPSILVSTGMNLWFP